MSRDFFANGNRSEDSKGDVSAFTEQFTIVVTIMLSIYIKKQGHKS
jgi:hypothetical protein